MPSCLLINFIMETPDLSNADLEARADMTQRLYVLSNAGMVTGAGRWLNLSPKGYEKLDVYGLVAFLDMYVEQLVQEAFPDGKPELMQRDMVACKLAGPLEQVIGRDSDHVRALCHWQSIEPEEVYVLLGVFVALRAEELGRI